MESRRNAWTGAGLAILVFGMVGVSFAAVPLYRLFCEATGFDGTPVTRGAAAPGPVGGTIEVRFDANTSAALPWGFVADQRVLKPELGAEQLASYSGVNRGGQTVTGVATYNVSPEKAARYFHKTACFCFNEQTLSPGQAMSFPLSFWVDPAIRTDPDTKDVQTITLSYTFFRSLDDARRDGALDRAGPHVGPRADALSNLNPAQFPR